MTQKYLCTLAKNGRGAYKQETGYSQDTTVSIIYLFFPLAEYLVLSRSLKDSHFVH